MAHAHTHALADGSPAMWIALGLLVIAGLLHVDRRRAWRRSTCVLALLVAIFGFESAIHSVHHLSDPQAAESCTLLSGSKHVDTAPPALPEPGSPLWMAAPAPPSDGDLAPPPRGFRTHEGRAPPARSAL